MKAVKRNLTVVLAVLAVLMFALGVVFMPKSNTTVSAAVKTESGFYIEDGASIRLVEKETGIKWRAHLTKDKFDLIEAGDEEHPAGTIVEIGIRIKPRGTDTWATYSYFKSSSGYTWVEGKDELVFNRAIHYDKLIDELSSKLQITGVGKLDWNNPEHKEIITKYLRQAYTTNLVAEPYVVVDPTEDGLANYTVAGESFDTDRSVQGVALYHLANGTYDDAVDDSEEKKAEKAAIRATLYSFVTTYELIEGEEGKQELAPKFTQLNVNQTRFEAVDSFYSNEDAYGKIQIDAELQEVIADQEREIKIYYGAKDVTDSYDATSGILALAKVDTLITEDGKPNDCLMIFDETSGEIYKQYFVGVTLAIDEAEDFKYFQLKGTLKVSSSTNISYTSDVDDFVFDGYYVLLNNIDAGSYAHVTLLNLPIDENGDTYTIDSKGEKSYLDASAITAAAVEKTNYGLSGTFDGRGYTVKNMFIGSHVSSTQNGLSLFGFVNGGTIKNVNFDHIYSANKTNRPDGAAEQNDSLVKTLIANHFVGNSVVEDVMITLGDMQSYAYASLFSTASADTRFTRVLVVSDNDRGINTENYMFSQFYGTMEDVYFVENIAPSVTTAVEYTINGSAVKVHKARYEAEYVDGVAINGVSTLFWKSATKYDSTKDAIYNGETQITTYEPNVLTNAKRYTSISAMQNSTIANDFSSWNSDIWEIVNNVPYFANSLTGEYVAYVGNDALDIDFVRPMEVGDELAFTVKYAGSSILALPEVEILSGEEYVSLAENVITATTQSNQTSVVVKVTYRNNSWIQNLVVYNKVTPTEYAETLYFSAHDGKFYDANFNVVGLDAIFGENVTLVRALDAEGHYLTLGANGELLNVDLGANDDWKATNYTLYTLDKGVIVNVLAADAIIDEAEDFEVFQLKGVLTVDSNYVSYSSDVDEFLFDGYFVLVKDIDASSYEHVGALNKIVKGDGTTQADGSTLSAAEVVKQGYGFTGTFNGNGYTVKNMFVGSGTNNNTQNGIALFTVINSGVIKNVSFENLYSADDSRPAGSTHTSRSLVKTAFANHIVNGAKIQDVSISLGKFEGYAFPSMFRTAEEGTTFTRVVITENYVGINNQNGICNSCLATMDEVYFISSKAPSVDKVSTLAVNGVSDSYYKSRTDAQYVDGVEIKDKLTTIVFDKNGKPYNADTAFTLSNVLLGAKRYTSVSAMQNSTIVNDFSSWNSDIWEIINGVPYMYSQIDSANVIKGYYTYNENTIEINENPLIIYKDESVSFSTTISDKATYFAPAIKIVDGEEFASLENGTLTAKEITVQDVIKVEVTYKDKTFTQQIKVIPAIENDNTTAYIFDVSTGKFYNDLYQVVGVNEIFGEETTVLYAEDADGNSVDVEDNVILGLAIEGETFVILHTGYRSVKVTINAIDQIVFAGYYDLAGEKVAMGETPIDIYADDVVEFSLTVNGEEGVVIPTLTFLDGADLVNVNGLKVMPKSSTINGIVTVALTYGDVTITQQINVLNVTVLPNEYYFSAYDGIFFDADFNVVGLEDVVAGATSITDASGNELTITDGAVLGLDLGKQDTWADTYLVITTKEVVYKLNLLAADMVFDEATDFTYFTLDGNVSFDEEGILTYDADDWYWDGYHVVVKDIDAGAYTHRSNSTNGTLHVDAREAAVSSIQPTNYGFSGVFDGQGYTIKNMYVDAVSNSIVTGTTNANNMAQQGLGLFTYVNNGVIKNVSFTNMYSGSKTPSGASQKYVGVVRTPFINSIVNNSVIQDVYLSMYRLGATQRYFLCYSSDNTSSINRVFIQDNDITRTNGNGHGFVGPASYATMTDVYVIESVPIMTNSDRVQCDVKDASGSALLSKTYLYYVTADAAYVDDVPVVNPYNYMVDITNKGTLYDVTSTEKLIYKYNTTTQINNSRTIRIFSGVKRYTDVANMQIDTAIAANDFTAWTATGFWTVANGVPSMHPIANA